MVRRKHSPKFKAMVAIEGYYNSDRLRQSLRYRSPNEVYYVQKSKFKINSLWSKTWGTLQCDVLQSLVKLQKFF